jgi:HEPN domain-containing protein
MVDLIYNNGNMLRPDGIHQECEGTRQKTVSIRCPHCSVVGAFQTFRLGLNYSKSATSGDQRFDVNLYAFQRVCPNPDCHGIVLTVTGDDGIIRSIPPELLDFDGSNLPPNISATLKEAISCHSAGAFRASAMMVRRLLEEVCEESQAEGKDLHARLNSLKTKITLPLDLFDAMFELKALGNDAAHIDAKSYSRIGKDEAQDSIELAQEILKALYQHKNLLARLKSRKT